MDTFNAVRGEQQTSGGDTKRFWRRLMPLLEENLVVPLIGRNLVTISDGRSSLPFYQWLAQRVAGELELPSDAVASLDMVTCQYLEQDAAHLDDVYAAIKNVLATPMALPKSLRQLAQISAFKLYVTTALDPLLERALADPTSGRRGPVQSLAFGLNSVADDLPVDIDQLHRPVVYYLLGRASAVRGNCAVTDEDILEFVHSLQVPERQPRNLFHALTSKHILLIGSGFPGWLLRFVLRLCNKDRLWAVRDKPGFIVDGQAAADAEQLRFLAKYSGQALYTAGGPDQFVEELSARWLQNHPPIDVTPPSVPAIDEHAPARQGVVFLSYASEDRAVVEQLSKDLNDRGIETWFDRSELKLGDAWRERLLAGIDEAVAFIPILSRSVLTPEPRQFRMEWERALEVNRRWPRAFDGNPRRFILPLIVDDIDPTTSGIVEYFGGFQAQHLPLRAGVRIPDEVVLALRTIVRIAHKSRECRP